MASQLDMHGTFTAMQNDRQIKLCIGDLTTPLLVPESILIKTFNFFRGALKRKSMKEGFEGAISFPEDSLTPWKVLNFWMINGEVPIQDCSNEDLVTAWYLADKYQITQLQDDLISELIEVGLNAIWSPKDHEEVLVHTTPDSLPRKWIAELLMIRVKDGAGQGMSWNDLAAFQGDNDYARDILEAAIAVEENSLLVQKYIPTDADEEEKPLWLRYMTKETKGPRKMHEWGWARYESGQWYSSMSQTGN
ncbi:hypothetical protein CLAFUW4_04033 [Fulvia fulva]|nr:hypothetical protein CLAFUR4_04019 [Fulvia fulva]WPV14285.1 hypothetical protein CLAFUW4_04033 [Fulvia fulva]WPV28549.1 hypothetical protein CLAFUW7_04022 [Fulvia fulva]